MSFYIIPQPEEFRDLSLHDVKMVIKYRKMARKMEMERSRKRRYAEYIKKKNGIG